MKTRPKEMKWKGGDKDQAMTSRGMTQTGSRREGLATAKGDTSCKAGGKVDRSMMSEETRLNTEQNCCYIVQKNRFLHRILCFISQTQQQRLHKYEDVKPNQMFLKTNAENGRVVHVLLDLPRMGVLQGTVCYNCEPREVVSIVKHEQGISYTHTHLFVKQEIGEREEGGR